MPLPGTLFGEARGLLWQAISLVAEACVSLFRLSDPPAATQVPDQFITAEGEDNQLI